MDLIEVGRPVEWSVSCAGATTKVDRVAQAFAETGKIPHPAILGTIVVAGGTADVSLQGETRVLGIVEVLFAEEHVGGKRLAGDRVVGGDEADVLTSAIDDLRDIVGGDAAAHEVVDIESATVG